MCLKNDDRRREEDVREFVSRYISKRFIASGRNIVISWNEYAYALAAGRILEFG